MSISGYCVCIYYSYHEPINQINRQNVYRPDQKKCHLVLPPLTQVHHPIDCHTLEHDACQRVSKVQFTSDKPSFLVPSGTGAGKETRRTSFVLTLQLPPYKYSINREPASGVLGETSEATPPEDSVILDKWGVIQGITGSRGVGSDASCCSCWRRPFLSATITF